MAAWIGPAISAAAGIFGALAGGGGGQQETRLNLGRLRRQAERNGFNPLTVLRATGGAGFTTTTLPSISSARTIMRAIGGGLEGLANAGIQGAENAAREDLLRAQLELVKAQTNRVRSSPMLGAVPRAHGTAVAGPSTAAALSGRRIEPNISPSAPPGFNAADRVSIDAAKERLMPRTIVPINPQVEYDVEAGTAGGQVLEDVAEPLAEIEGARRVGVVAQQNPPYAGQIAMDLLRGAGSSVQYAAPPLQSLRWYYKYIEPNLPKSKKTPYGRRLEKLAPY